MYWRDYYPDHESAFRADHLSGLGKVKLTVAQKQAIQAAKADAKVKLTLAKQEAKVTKATQKIQAAEAKRVNKIRMADARADARIAKYASSVPAAVDAGIIAYPQVAAEQSPAMDLTSAPTTLPFAQGGGGGGGGFMPTEPYSFEQSQAGQDAATFGIPMPVLLGAGALVLLLIFMKK